jgi:hypothetical protein
MLALGAAALEYCRNETASFFVSFVLCCAACVVSLSVVCASMCCLVVLFFFCRGLNCIECFYFLFLLCLFSPHGLNCAHLRCGCSSKLLETAVRASLCNDLDDSKNSRKKRNKQKTTKI